LITRDGHIQSHETELVTYLLPKLRCNSRFKLSWTKTDAFKPTTGVLTFNVADIQPQILATATGLCKGFAVERPSTWHATANEWGSLLTSSTVRASLSLTTQKQTVTACVKAILAQRSFLIMALTRLDQLYRQVILDHSSHPQSTRTLKEGNQSSRDE